MDNSKFPPIDQALVEALAVAFPDRVPHLSDTDREVWVKVGNVEVVRFLRSKMEEQHENPLGDP